MTGAPVVDFESVYFSYSSLPVLEGISLSIQEKEFLAVVGPNGGGKTTLLKILLGLERPDHGQVRVFGQDPRRVRRLMGYVPQLSHLANDFPINVENVVLLGRLEGGSLGMRPSTADRRAAQKAMEAVDIAALSQRRMDSLSGGQHQRVMIARALAGEPRLLILDEPTASVDSRVEQNIFDLLKRLNQSITIILVTHDLGFVSRYVSRVACLNRELVCHHTGEITAEVLEKLYGTAVKMIHHECEL